MRADYSAAVRYLRRRQIAAWAGLRVLVPPERQPHVAAASALARYTDDLCDRGPVEGRKQRFGEWAARVGRALDTGGSDNQLIRAYLHSESVLTLSRQWIGAYLAGTRTDVEFHGFADEADYQRYIDIVALPALMLVTEPVLRLVSDTCFEASARLIADGTQRAEFLTDLFEDLRDGRLALPVCDLEAHGVTRQDLRDGRDTPGVRALIAATASAARASLVQGERIVDEVAPEYRPMLHGLIGVFHKRLDDVSIRGAAITRRPYQDAPVACLRLLVSSRRVGDRRKSSPTVRNASSHRFGSPAKTAAYEGEWCEAALRASRSDERPVRS